VKICISFLADDLFYIKNRDSLFLKIVGNQISDYTVSYIRRYHIKSIFLKYNPSVVKWSEFLATDPKVPGSVPGATIFMRSSGSGSGSTQPREDN
jgi:hypothetical protein